MLLTLHASLEWGGLYCLFRQQYVSDPVHCLGGNTGEHGSALDAMLELRVMQPSSFRAGTRGAHGWDMVDAKDLGVVLVFRFQGLGIIYWV